MLWRCIYLAKEIVWAAILFHFVTKKLQRNCVALLLIHSALSFVDL